MLEEEGMEVGGDEGAHPARRNQENSTTHLSTSRRVINIPENIYYNQDGDYKPENIHHFLHTSEFRGGPVCVPPAAQYISTQKLFW